MAVTGCALQVPAGALTEPTLITMTRHEDDTIELGPHGQVFAVDVELLFVHPLVSSAEDYLVQWYDPSQESWTTIPSYVSGFARAAALEHFSLYRLMAKK